MHSCLLDGLSGTTHWSIFQCDNSSLPEQRIQMPSKHTTEQQKLCLGEKKPTKQQQKTPSQLWNRDPISAISSSIPVSSASDVHTHKGGHKQLA